SPVNTGERPSAKCITNSEIQRQKLYAIRKPTSQPRNKTWVWNTHACISRVARIELQDLWLDVRSHSHIASFDRQFGPRVKPGLHRYLEDGLSNRCGETEPTFEIHAQGRSLQRQSEFHKLAVWSPFQAGQELQGIRSSSRGDDELRTVHHGLHDTNAQAGPLEFWQAEPIEGFKAIQASWADLI